MERMCAICGKFLDELVDNMGTKGDAKFHVASYLKQFFNNEIKNARTITNVQSTLKALGKFYHEKMQKEIAKVKSAKSQTAKRDLMFKGLKYLEDNEREFAAMLALYKTMQEQSNLLLINRSILKHLEHLYKRTKDTVLLTLYVLHHNGDMIKLVNRIEFSYINFTLSKEWNSRLQCVLHVW